MTTARARRPAVLVALVAGFLAVLLVGSAAVPGAAVPVVGDERPDIVFVLTDDLDTSLLKYMPNVAALAARGTSFSRYVVADSWCCPSRASILTGEYPHNTGVRNNGQDENGGFGAFHRLGDEDRTFAVHLHDAGYRTGFAGKYLNGYAPLATVPPYGDDPGGQLYIPPGWDHWYGVGNGYPEYDYTANADGRREVHGHTDADYLNTVLQTDATRFITKSARTDQPFVLEIAPFSPHLPATPAPRDVGTLTSVKAPRGPAWKTLPTSPPAWLASVPPIRTADAAAIDAVARTRAQAVRSIDRMVGALQNTLAKTGRLDHTVFVFSSDNGYHLGQYRLRPGKLTAFDTDIRVPLVVAGPGIPAGATTDLLAQNTDLAPTFEELGGAPVPAEVDGHSLVDVLHGTAPDAWRQRAFVEHQAPPPGDDGDPDGQTLEEGQPISYEAIRGPDYTYVQYVDGELEYYDLATDPDELHNVAAGLDPMRQADLAAAVAALRTCSGASCWTAAGGG